MTLTAGELVWAGALGGPTLWGGSGAAVESLLFGAVGAVLGFRFVTRRRAGMLFAR